MIDLFSTQTLGFVAAACTTLAFLPQVIKTWRSRSTKDLSLFMFLVFSTGVTLWLIYGMLRGDWPLILANLFTLSLAVIILAFKIKDLMRGRGTP